MRQFTKDLIDSYRKMKAQPLFNAAMPTPESYPILSAATLVINK